MLEKIVKLEELEEVTRLAEEAKGRKWKEHSSDLVSKISPLQNNASLSP